MFIDARTIPSGTVLSPDLAIIGGGPAGISLALALADRKMSVALFESGGMAFDQATQKLYSGAKTGVNYLALDGSRLRFFGGSTNHWGGWCRPLDLIDFEKRDWLPHSGWPITRKAIEPYFARAQSLVEAGPFVYDNAESWAQTDPVLKLGKGGVYTSWFQFSRTRDSVLPTHFGQRYADDLKQARNLKLYFQANVTGLRLAPDARTLSHLDVATLSGRHFAVKPRYAVLATGAMESARLLLASNDVISAGVGNQNDLVGRYFADHPIPRDTATLVVFDGDRLANYYPNPLNTNGAILRATFAPREDYQRQSQMLGSLTTVEDPAKLDDLGRAVVAETAAALGVDASNAKAYSLGCGMELAPDPERRLMLDGDRDALGMPQLKLQMRIADSDFDHYRATMKELGRQLLAARTGMIRLDRKAREEWLSVIDWGNHHLGTTRMSADPKTGVVDANLAVHGIPNLFVAGSSTFPTYGASNPTMNLVALTLRLGDHLKGLIA